MRSVQKIIVIVGPTASGKTAASIALAQALDGEIISADSRQVYKGLDIGTGKVTAEEMRGIPHHLLDVADPEKQFSAADYATQARAAIASIAARGKVPVIVGGTGFYIDALLGRIGLTEVPENPMLRASLKEKSVDELFRQLQSIDPRRAKTIDAKNPVRLVRAIEIAETLGAVPEVDAKELYNVLWLGILPSPETLAENIHVRLRARMADGNRAQSGMLEEARELHEKGLSYERMEALGLEYRYLARYLQGKISKDVMLEQLETEIKKYAKRQMTWFKRNTAIKWFSPEKSEEMLAAANAFISLH